MSVPVQPTSSVPLILLGGASGSGKSYLAEHFGHPHLALDDFYREASEDAVRPMPRTPYGEIDWDHPETWNADAAVRGVQELQLTGRTSVPKYSIEHSAYFGRKKVLLDGGPIVAEGIFAETALRVLRAAGVECTAYYVDQHRALTALQRFVRDVREHRKPLPFLVQRGWALFRAEPAFRRRHLEAGFVPVSKRRLKRVLAQAASAR